MLGNVMTIIGASIILIGTIISLIPALSIDQEKVGTCEWYDTMLIQEYKTQKKQAKVGIAVIILGTISQVVGTFL